MIEIEDTGWITLERLNGFKVYNGSTGAEPKVRRVGKDVFLSGVVSPPIINTLGSEEEMAICTIPALMRPANMIYVISQGSSYYIWLLKVYPNGDVTASRHRNTSSYAAANSSAWLTFYTNWAV